MTKTILLADDSLTIQKVVELTFADTPYNVVAVSSGDELLDKISEIEPELIICDIIMPGRDGYDVCQNIKSSPETLHLPVILLSGTFEPLDRDRALAVGCSEILTKPFEARKLIDTVERLLRRRDDADAGAGATAKAAETGPVSPQDAGGSDFGTRIATVADAAPAASSIGASAAGDEAAEGLDFTETGFAEMEAAAVTASDRPTAAPREGLDFEIGDGGDIDPFADLDDEPAGEPEYDDITGAFDAADEPFADVPDEFDEEGDEDAVFDTPRRPAGDIELAAAGPAEVTEDDTLFEAEDDGDDSVASDEAGFAAASSAPLDDSGFSLQSPEEAFGEAPAVVTDADTAPLPALGSAGERPAEASPAEPTGGARLSDEDVDRIARRILELADEKIEQIAWEVIPDVAEIVVRERIRKLEAELETEN